MHANKKIQAVHKFLDAFELWVISRPAPNSNLTHVELASLKADVNTILEIKATDQENTPNELAMDSMLNDLLIVYDEPLTEKHLRIKRNRSSHTTKVIDQTHAKNKERK